MRALSRLVGKMNAASHSHDRGPECQQSELRSRSYAVSGLPGRAKVVGLSPEPVEREEHVRKAVDLVIESDGSLAGWGAVCNHQRTGGALSSTY